LGHNCLKSDKDCFLDGRKTYFFETAYPKSPEFYGFKIHVYVDKEYNLPVKFTVFNSEEALIEDYQFYKLKVNVGLKSIDFDTENQDYEY
jgi:outer membrane lipoprotein-sorting protein